MRLWLKPCPRCRAGRLLEQRDGILTRITCVACSHVLTPAQRRLLIEGLLDGGLERIAQPATHAGSAR